MAKATGTYMEVDVNWAVDFAIDRQALEKAFDNLRHNASKEGCHNFPSRDDVAANDKFFHEVRRMYQIYTGNIVESKDYPKLRRHILKVHKNGRTPK